MWRVLVVVCLVGGCRSDRTPTTTEAPKVEPTKAVVAPAPAPVAVPAIAPRELPGFKMSLPAGTVLQEQLAHPEGVVALRQTHGEGSMTMVTWIAGQTSREDFADGMTMFGNEFGGASTPVVEPSPPDAPTKLTGTMTATDGTHVRMSSWPCGVRIVQVLTASRDATVNDALHRAIAASFACVPDQAADDAIPTGVVRYDMTLPGWKAIRKTDSSVMLVADPGSIILIDNEMNTLTAADAVRDPRSLLTNVKLGATKAGRTPFTATAGDQPVMGWAQEIQCTWQVTRIIIVAVAPTKQGLDEITKLAKSGHCLSVKAAAPVWPDAPT